METIRVFYIYDNLNSSNQLMHYLKSKRNIRVIGHVHFGKMESQKFIDIRPHIILIDVASDNLTKISDACEIGEAKVIILTDKTKKELICAAYQAGITDYLIDSNYQIIFEAICSAHKGCSPIRADIAETVRKEFRRLRDLEETHEIERLRALLSEREIEILTLILEDCTQVEISKRLYISLRTVKNHVNSILRKMGETSSKEAARKAEEIGLI